MITPNYDLFVKIAYFVFVITTLIKILTGFRSIRTLISGFIGIIIILITLMF